MRRRHRPASRVVGEIEHSQELLHADGGATAHLGDTELVEERRAILLDRRLGEGRLQIARRGVRRALRQRLPRGLAKGTYDRRVAVRRDRHQVGGDARRRCAARG